MACLGIAEPDAGAACNVEPFVSETLRCKLVKVLSAATDMLFPAIGFFAPHLTPKNKRPLQAIYLQGFIFSFV